MEMLHNFQNWKLFVHTEKIVKRAEERSTYEQSSARYVATGNSLFPNVSP